jgi:hypothetical protein
MNFWARNFRETGKERRNVMNNKNSICKSCSRLATLVFGVILLTQTSPANDNQFVRPVEQPVVVDAHGDALGSVVALNGPATMVLIDVGGGVFSLNVLPTQLLGTGGSLYFTTSNCTGTPYISFQPPGLSTPSTLAAPGNSLYAAVPNATPLPITALSLLLPSIPGGPPASCQSTTPPPPPGAPPPPPPPQVFAIAAMRLVDLNTIFTPPFRIRSN